MKIRGVRYFFSEAFKNFFSNGWMTLASIFTVVASLLVLGSFLALTININNMADNLKEGYQIVVFVDDKVSDYGVKTIGEKLDTVENVDQILYTSKAERLENLRNGMSDKASSLDRYKEDNPFRHMYQVSLFDLSASAETLEEIKQIDGVDEVLINEEHVNKLMTIANYIQNFSFWIIMALAIVSVFIISNTIRLTVYTRRKEINIMKFVGATDWFIRWPFIIEGILIGVLGAGISIGLILSGYSFLIDAISSLNIVIFTMKPLTELVPILVGSSLGLGAILGGIGSLISVRKHLNV